MSEATNESEPLEAPRTRPKMVDWYGPVQLVKTGGGILLSTLLGSMLDSRRLQAVEGSEKDSVIDYSGTDTFTLDYLADTGDGWNSTYTMAYLLTSPSLEVETRGEESANLTLERANAVILGGDQVYPVASKKLYADRLVSPFNQAPEDIRSRLGKKRLPIRDIYLIPGNHDWYDSLGSFSRRFLAVWIQGSLKAKRLGQFKTRQVRSYFVLKLSHDWEIWALDIQLTRDVDNQQFNFFAQHAENIGAQTRIILCVAEPTLVYGCDVEQEKQELVFGLKRISKLAFDKGARVLVQLAGDVHNYQRYEVAKKTKTEEPYTRQHIVSGGGGAFLHPTHSFHRDSEKLPHIESEKRYPERSVSRRLSHRNLLFAWMHKGMSVLLGLVYLFMFWSGGVPGDWKTFPVERPGAFLMILAVVVGCSAFAGFGRWKTALWGTLHGLGHIPLAVLSWRLGAALAEGVPGSGTLLAIYLPRLLTFALGAILGGSLFGLYLWCSLNLLRFHHNEAFSSICSPHYKHFLRCTFRPDRSLLIRVLGVERTAPQSSTHPAKVHLVEEILIQPDP